VVRILSCLCLAAGLAGCAGLSQRQCAGADWERIGREDGARGYPASRIEQHRTDCARHGVTPDAARYEAGREAGLARYCTPEGMLEAGARGAPFAEACDPADTTALREHHARGLELHLLDQRIDQVRRDLQWAETLYLASLPRDVWQLRLRLDQLLFELRRLQFERDRLALSWRPPPGGIDPARY
jgi:hypothetical protein